MTQPTGSVTGVRVQLQELIASGANVHAIIGAVERTMRVYGIDEPTIDAYRNEAIEADYDTMLAVTHVYVEVV